MCHSRTNNKKFDSLHERGLRTNSHHLGSYLKRIAVSIHEKYVLILATEMYKVSNNFSPPHMNEIFEVRNEHTYNLRKNSQFAFSISISRNCKSFLFRTKNLGYRFTKI